MGWVQFPSYRLPAATFERTFLMGDLDPNTEGPQVQALVQPNGNVIPAHFHDIDQFQVVVGGSGVIGRHRFKRGMFRYIDRHRVYGPVRPDEDGLVYLTLRREHDVAGPHYMPESRDALAERRPVDPRGLGFDCDALDTCWRDVSYGDPDDLYVRALNVGRHGPVDLTMDGGGGFVVLVGGTLDNERQSGGFGDYPLPRSAVSACWVEPGSAIAVHAGESGARVLQLQFPVR